MLKSFLGLSQLPGEHTTPSCILSAHGLIHTQYHLSPHRSPFIHLGEEKQLWLSVLLKDTSIMASQAGTRTHTPMTLPPELESSSLDRSATTLHMYGTCDLHVHIQCLFLEILGAGKNIFSRAYFIFWDLILNFACNFFVCWIFWIEFYYFFFHT